VEDFLDFDGFVRAELLGTNGIGFDGCVLDLIIKIIEEDGEELSDGEVLQLIGQVLEISKTLI
jgi:hypothetical protein